jgi:hypothetical protein
MRLIVITFALLAASGPVGAQAHRQPRLDALPPPAPPATTQPLPDRPTISLEGRKLVRIVAPYGFTGSSDFKDHPVVSGHPWYRHRVRHLPRVRPIRVKG